MINLDDLEAKAKATKGAYQVIPAMEYYEAANPETILTLITITRTSQSILSHIDHGDGDWTKIVGELRTALKEIE